MIRHYAHVSIRMYRKGGSRTFINILGLSIGLAVCLLMLLFIRSELGYDAHLENGDRLFRVSVREKDESGTVTLERAAVSPAIAPTLASNYSQVQGFARLMPVGPSISREDRTIYPDHFYWGDSSALDLLEIDFIAGGASFDTPLSVVLSASTAEKLGGGSDLIGEAVNIAGESFTVTGIFQDLPSKTHLHVDAIGSIGILTHWFNTVPNQVWDSPNYATYVRLAPGVDADRFQADLADFFSTYAGSRAPEHADLRLQPVRDIHLRSSVVSEFEPQGSLQTVLLMSLIAGIVLLIACANFVNLATARALRQAKEVGLRKVVGATRGQLALQFLGEAVVFTLISLFIGGLLAQATAPAFGSFVGKSLSLFAPEFRMLLPVLVGAGVLLGLLAGSYPAFVLSSFRPASIFQRRGGMGRGKSLFSSFLVTGQFALAIALVICTLVVFRQLEFAQTQDPGFDSEQVMLLPGMRSIAHDFEPFRERLLAHPDVIDVSHAWREPLQPLLVSSELQSEVDGSLHSIQVFSMFADDHYFSTFGIETVAGRTFDPVRGTEDESIFVLNETAVEKLGYDSPADAVDTQVRFAGRSGTVIGVVKDYHQESFHTRIAPMIIWQFPQNYRVVGVRFRSNDIPGLTRFLRTSWQEVEGDSPISVDFLDDRYEAVYQSEQRLATAFGAFAGLGIFVACLGLFGVSASAMERRIREIGVRKVFGATTRGLVARMTGEFLRLVLVAFLVAAPVAWIVMDRWLDGFAYHTNIGTATVAVALLLALIVAGLAVVRETWSAARANPVDSLRCE